MVSVVEETTSRVGMPTTICILRVIYTAVCLDRHQTVSVVSDSCSCVSIRNFVIMRSTR